MVTVYIGLGSSPTGPQAIAVHGRDGEVCQDVGQDIWDQLEGEGEFIALAEGSGKATHIIVRKSAIEYITITETP